MLYTVAGPDWSPNLPLRPAETLAGLYRTREEAAGTAPGRPTLAVALRYDATRGIVVAQPPAARGLPGGWSAPAIVNGRGGVTVLSPIPPALVRPVGRAEIRAHAPHAGPPGGPHGVVHRGPARTARGNFAKSFDATRNATQAQGMGPATRRADPRHGPNRGASR